MNRVLVTAFMLAALVGCGGTVLAEDKGHDDCVMDLEICPQHSEAVKGTEVYRMEQCSIPYACPVDDHTQPSGWVCVRYVMADCFDRNPE